MNEQYKGAYIELDHKLHNYYPKNSIVGQLLTNNPGSNTFVDADCSGHMENKSIMGEHDPFAWIFDKDENGDYCGFEETDQTGLSKMLDRVIDSNLKGLSSREKADTLKALLKLGIPNFISGDKNYDYLDYSSFKNFIISIMSDKGLTNAEIRALLGTALGILTALVEYGLIQTRGFILPDIDKLYYMIRDWGYDQIRKVKNKISDFLNWIMYGGSDKAPNEATGYNQPDKVHGMYDFRNDKQGRIGSSAAQPVSFSVNCDSLGNQSLQFEKLSNNLSAISGELQGMVKNCDGNGLLYVKVVVSATANSIKDTASTTRALGTALDSVLKEYQKTETTILAAMPG